MTTHRVETDAIDHGYTARCLDCPYTSTHPALSAAVRAGNDHLTATEPPGDEH